MEVRDAEANRQPCIAPTHLLADHAAQAGPLRRSHIRGRRLEIAGSLDWRPSPHAFLSIQYEQNDVDLDEGDFITRLLRVRVNAIFTPYLSWNTFLQYDNVSDLLGINSRIRWIVDPGNEIFLVFNQGWAVDDTAFRPLRSELTFKLGWTFRF